MKKHLLFYTIILASIFGFSIQELQAQSEGGRLAFGLHGGGTKYWGEFTDNQFWLSGDLYLRYNILPFLSIHASVGGAQNRYKLTDNLYNSYSDYFGTRQTGYPDDPTIRKEDKNAIRTLIYQGLLSVNAFPSQSFVPYIAGGVAYVDWNVATLTGNQTLPFKTRPDANTKASVAASLDERGKVMFPVGGGFEWYMTEDFAFTGRGLFYFTGTDYFDGYATAGSDNDAFTTFGIGGTYYILGETDTDKDGLSNDEERRIGTDPFNPDTDADGLTDYEEVRTYATNPLKADTDGDNLNDLAELRQHLTDPLKADTDSDNLNDGEELARRTDPLKPDTDGDGLLDGDEVTLYRTEPTRVDTDEDGLSDGDEIRKYKTDPLATDTDRDTLRDGDEINMHNTDPAKADTDDDGLNDGDEINRHKTDPRVADSDNDKLTDGEEVNRFKTNPLVADTDNDGLIDGDEVSARYNTDPLNPDTDRDRILDGQDDCPLIAGVPSEEPGKNGCPAPPKVGTRVDFPEIYFIVDTDQFNYTFPETAQNLAKLLAYVNQCENLRVRVEGHASAEGSAKRNQELSDMRAQRVRTWLIENGADANKVSETIGYGSSRPKVAEPTGAALKKMKAADLEALRKLNRRITVEVTQTCD